MDVKTSRMFVKGVVVHLQKSLRSYDDKDTDALVKTINEHLRMIEMVAVVKKSIPKKKKSKSKPKPTDADATAVAPAAVAAAACTPST